MFVPYVFFSLVALFVQTASTVPPNFFNLNQIDDEQTQTSDTTYQSNHFDFDFAKDEYVWRKDLADITSTERNDRLVRSNFRDYDEYTSDTDGNSRVWIFIVVVFLGITIKAAIIFCVVKYMCRKRAIGGVVHTQTPYVLIIPRNQEPQPSTSCAFAPPPSYEQAVISTPHPTQQKP